MVLNLSTCGILVETCIVAIGHNANIRQLLWQEILEPHRLVLERLGADRVRVQAMDGNDTVVGAHGLVIFHTRTRRNSTFTQ